MSFEELLNRGVPDYKMNPLDLVFINSKSVYSSLERELIFDFGGYSFNHIGILIDANILPEYCPDKDKFYVIESTFNSTIWPKGFRVLSLKQLRRDSHNLHHVKLKANPWLESVFIQRNRIKELLRNILSPEMMSNGGNNSSGWWNPLFTLYQLFQGFYTRIFPIQLRRTLSSPAIANIYATLKIFPIKDLECITLVDILQPDKESSNEVKDS